MKTTILSIISILLWLVIWYLVPKEPVDYNANLMYGSSGLPKNCRAIITENIKAYRNNEYSASDIMESIDRNCWANWYSWEIE